MEADRQDREPAHGREVRSGGLAMITNDDRTAKAGAEAALASSRLPAGLVLRPWRGLDGDLPAMWAVSDAARLADGEVERQTYDVMAGYYRHLERSDLSRDLVIAELDGGVVGYARVEWNDSNDGERWYEGVCNVEPAHRRRRIGAALLGWSEQRRFAIAAGQDAAET